VAPDILTVVLPHREQPEHLMATVAGFAGQGVPVAFTVVDNGSSPAALARIDAGLADLGASGALHGAPVEVVPRGTNTGFGPAANVGLRQWLAGGAGEWAVVAPHDAMPLEGCLPYLLSVLAERPGAGLASADVGDGLTPVIDRYFGSIPAPATVDRGWEPAGYPHGTLMIARRACLEEIGLFDERYFAYCEEADMGERARRAGWEVGVVRGAEVRNMHLSTTTPAVDYLQQRNTLLLVRDSFGRYPAFIRLVTGVLQVVKGVVRPSTRTEVFSARARIWAMADHLRGRYGPPPERLARRAADPRPVGAAT
jgi:GT2 family glycosyltransferase